MRLVVHHEAHFADGWLKEEFADGVGANVLYVDGLTLEPGWKGRNIEQAVVRRLCDTVGAGCALAVVPYGAEGEAAPWVRMGFEVTRSPPDDECGYLTLRLALRNARILEEDDRCRIVPNPSPKEKRKHH